MKESIKSIAIVGGGAAGISLFNYLTKKINGNKCNDNNVNITIYEKKSCVGPGIAYQDDYDFLLLNRNSKQMSVIAEEPDHFWNWYKSQYKVSFEQEEFLPRSVFGEYLKNVFEESVERAIEKNIAVCVKYSEVANLRKERNYVLITRDGKTQEFDQVLLCLGNTRLHDHYYLNGQPQFIYNPYPLKQTVSLIPKNANIAILGSSLTAVDICLALKENGHNGKIDMLSRNGELPSVRGEVKPHKLKYLTHDTLNQLFLKRNAQIRLRDITKLIKKEFEETGLEWKQILSPKSHHSNAKKKLEEEIKNILHQSAWQSVLMSTNEIIEKYWHFLNEVDKNIYLNKYDRTFMSRRNPMPLVNATKILNLMNKGQLSVKSDVVYIDYLKDHTFYVQFNNRKYINYDWIINATGPSKHLSGPCKSGLIGSLISNGYATINHYGGVKTDFDSGALINKSGQPDTNLRALGHITCGTYYFTNSMEMIAKHAKQISEDTSDLINQSVQEDKEFVSI
ncbi:FAD/NAD(P)-binding protein [Metabacillus arenae]|uniref:FAD/NAD(P)-binding protein n=1 Tax=Metabacillus arenae TaxID=2771434 RepID=A0A926RZR2_9BACI|nr:FAD/NAD(P)-binding protein [Metabacillus arenae]MBD1383090.1 FAD/NAD(P)-binding protein [Metabacillus arenae]